MVNFTNVKEAVEFTNNILRKASEEIINKANAPALKSLESRMKFRIHNKGENSQGTKIGNYTSKQYAGRRERNGRQTNYVDLQFDGRLKDAFQTGIRDGKFVLEFNPDIMYGNLTSGELADVHEERYGDVWRPSQEELDEYLKILKIQIRKGMKEFLDKTFKVSL